MSIIDAISISKFMTSTVKTINHTDSLKQAAKLMYENDIGSLVVVWSYEPTKPAGIVTERDIMKAVSFDQLYQPTLPHEISLRDMTVMSFMSTPVITIPPSVSLWDALQVMQQNKIRRLPVVQNEKLIGIITEKDIVRAIANNRSIICELQDRMPATAESVFERLREVTLSESLFPIR
jgi:CBS domain-containing protein